MLVLLQDNRRDDLRRMFQLFMRDSVPLKEGPMAEVFESFVSQEGAKALSARKAEQTPLRSRGFPPEMKRTKATVK